MAMRIKGSMKVAVTTTAQDVPIKYRDILIVNNSESTVFFCDKDVSGQVTAETGYALLPKTQMPIPVTASTLSIIGSGTADVRLLFVDIV